MNDQDHILFLRGKINMDKDELFKLLKKQTKATLLEFLYSTYYETNDQQNWHIFDDV